MLKNNNDLLQVMLLCIFKIYHVVLQSIQTHTVRSFILNLWVRACVYAARVKQLTYSIMSIGVENFVCLYAWQEQLTPWAGEMAQQAEVLTT